MKVMLIVFAVLLFLLTLLAAFGGTMSVRSEPFNEVLPMKDEYTMKPALGTLPKQPVKSTFEEDEEAVPEPFEEDDTYAKYS
jgi:hypothetical protein